MKIDRNFKTANTKIYTTEEVIQNQVKEFIHRRMDEGNAGPVNRYNRKSKGWSMMAILAEVSERYGRDMTEFAKNYIVHDVCKIEVPPQSKTPLSLSSNHSKTPRRYQMNKSKPIYLECPYAEKDEAKDLGAKWDQRAQKWFVPDDIDENLFKKWWPKEVAADQSMFSR